MWTDFMHMLSKPVGSLPTLHSWVELGMHYAPGAWYAA